MAATTHHAPAPTEAQMQHAFAQVRAAGWPPSLAELQLDSSPLATARLGIVRAAALHVAHGGQLTRPDLSGPITDWRLKPAPAHHAHPHPARRHGDAVDLKRVASGDKEDD
ncbi:hypothetical protein [Roseateles asaccharophilus]|uniref:Uncharacterized protein n=1 Tax=Roseateles asaccharophilus TaxID=582607 RepID=A0ABU2A3P8_9BURK|nr:hypothetical protein [Roseateles asaccharophilus]MDR7331735.1 hypothetical protein [Roseateles asaccharophilus]